MELDSCYNATEFQH